MLLLTQLAAGMYFCLAALNVGGISLPMHATGALSTFAFAALNLGLAVSILHLGRPLGAWRAFLGLRTSWMSREIVAFSVFAGAGGTLFAIPFAGLIAGLIPTIAPVLPWVQHPYTIAAIALFTAALAALSVFCSAMIYVDTRRAFWAAPITLVKFFGTSLLLGSAGTAMVLSFSDAFAPTAFTHFATLGFAWITLALRTVLFGWETNHLRETLRDETSPSHIAALNQIRLLKPLLVARAGLFAGATILGLLAVQLDGGISAVCATTSFLLTLGSQLGERFCFFTAVDVPRMPGGVAK